MSDLTHEQIEQYREIVKNAPKGATHVDAGEYMRHVVRGDWQWFSVISGWSDETKPEGLTQSLDNLRTIIAQHDRIAELERELEIAERHLLDDAFQWYVEDVEQLRKGAGDN